MSEVERRLRADKIPAAWEQRPMLWDQETYDTYSTEYWRGGWEAPMNWYKAFLDNYEDELEFVGKLLVTPFLIVLGQNDPAVPLQAVAGSDTFLKNCKVISLPYGHWLPQESGPAIVRAVLEWLGGLELYV